MPQDRTPHYVGPTQWPEEVQERGREHARRREREERHRAETAQAGERPRASGDFICEECHYEIHVTQGEEIPDCPHCGNKTFETAPGSVSP